jgi:pimeloyl-ACP methyl ester carboxylesterase
MIHALPGMGANRRMYPAPWSSLPDFVAHDWTPYSNEKSLADIAQSTCNARGIRDGDSLVGSSLGGMVACEITKIRKIKTLYLIGSATRKEEINAVLSMLHPLIHIAPIDWLRFSAGKIPNELTQRFAEAEASFLRAMCSAIFDWQGLVDSSTQVYRIHGKKDFVIPPPAKVDLILDGGHLISITHPVQCVEFIKAKLNSN